VNNDGYPDMFTMDMLPNIIINETDHGGLNYMFYQIDEKFGWSISISGTCFIFTTVL